jgi:hypothetical protein
MESHHQSVCGGEGANMMTQFELENRLRAIEKRLGELTCENTKLKELVAELRSEREKSLNATERPLKK